MTQDQQGTAVVKYDEIRRAGQLSIEKWNDDRIRAVIAMMAPSARTAAQAAMFLTVCDRYQLDPVLREAWLGELNGKPTVITGRDSYIKVAQRDPGYLGFDADVVRAKDEFSVERNGDEIRVHHKKSGFERGTIVGAYAVAYHATRRPVYIEKLWSELGHLTNRPTWKQNPSEMVLTRAITFALKLQFNLSGIYSPADEYGPEGEGGDGAQAEPTLEEKLRARATKPPTEITGTPVAAPAAPAGPDFEEVKDGEPADDGEPETPAEIVPPGEPWPDDARAVAQQPAAKPAEVQLPCREGLEQHHKIYEEAIKTHQPAWTAADIAAFQAEQVGKPDTMTWDVVDYDLAVAFLRRGVKTEKPKPAPRGGRRSQGDLL